MRKVLSTRTISSRHLAAAVALAEEGSFSRAAIRLHTGQSALTKQVGFIEHCLGFELFSRHNREVTPTVAGQAFVEQARVSLEYHERAIQMARASNEGIAHVIHVGKSPYTDPYFLSRLHSVHLPKYPNLRVQTTTKFAPELAHEVITGSLDLAFLTGMPISDRLTSIAVDEQPIFVAMLEEDPLAQSPEILCNDLEHSSCILFERHVHPYLYDTLVRVAKPASLPGTSLHHMMTAEEGSNLIHRGLGVAVMTQAGAWRIAKNGITMRPLNCEVKLETRLTCRSDMRVPVVSAFYRAFIKHTSSVGS